MAFQQLGDAEIGRHVRLLGAFFLAAELFSIAIGGCIFLFYVGIGFASGDPEAAPILGLLGLFVLSLFIVFAIPGVIAGAGLLRGSWWARPLGMVAGFLNMAWFPIGTVLGLYAFYVLLQESAQVYFARDGDLGRRAL